MSERFVIRGGEVADGSGGPVRSGDVVVEGDRIAAIVSPGTAVDGDQIDARGMVVAPGLPSPTTPPTTGRTATPAALRT